MLLQHGYGVCGRIGPLDSILIIRPEWLNRILSGEKTWEIRDKGCQSKIGRWIWLSASESSTVTGRAQVVDSRHLSAEEWEATRLQHCVPGPRFYGDRTHAWCLQGVRTTTAPLPFERKPGAVVWQTGPGP